MNIEELIHKRQAASERIHTLSFYVSLAFSVLFFWMLGGNSYLWCILFALSGIVIDFVKKTQLDIAAVTPRRRTRAKHKLVAFVMTLFSLLAGLGASLLRAQTVASVEIAASSTDSIDKKIAIAEAEYNVQLNQVNTSTRKEWRDNAQSNADKAKAELNALIAEKDKIKGLTVGKEKTADMFMLLAEFFGFGANAGRFMVILLMLAQAATELSIWVTTPQYWKDAAKPVEKKAEEPKPEPAKPEAPKAVKSAPMKTPEMAPAAKIQPRPAVAAQKPPASTPRPEKIAPRADFSIPSIQARRSPLPERVLRVESEAQAKAGPSWKPGDLFGEPDGK